MLSKSTAKNKWFWCGKEITEAEYSHILAIIQSRPNASDGFAYRLTAGLEWESYELPVENTEPDLTDTELLEILLGGST